MVRCLRLGRIGLVVVAVSVGVMSTGAAAVRAAAGAAAPVAATGIGSKAATGNPRCSHGASTYGSYGRFDSTTVGGGPVCVKPWKDGSDNGGATSAGVSKDAITV